MGTTAEVSKGLAKSYFLFDINNIFFLARVHRRVPGSAPEVS
jgi:hypothetical protein